MGEERMPVTMTEDAREFMYSSGPESAKFPQALAEAFQVSSLPVTIAMSLTKKNDIIPTNDRDEMLIVTEVNPTVDLNMPVVIPAFAMYTNSDDLKQMRHGAVYGFNALKTAVECVRLYRQHYKDAL
jgi:hypothetical protein